MTIIRECYYTSFCHIAHFSKFLTFKTFGYSTNKFYFHNASEFSLFL